MLFFYFIPIRSRSDKRGTFIFYFVSYVYIYTGCYWALAILYTFYSSLFYILLLYLPDSCSPAPAHCFLLLSVNQAAAWETTLCSFIREARRFVERRDPQIPERRITIGDLAVIHGGPLTSREGDLRVSMKIPAVAPRRGRDGR